MYKLQIINGKPMKKIYVVATPLSEHWSQVDALYTATKINADLPKDKHVNVYIKYLEV